MEQQEEIVITPIERLINFFGEELFHEVIYNQDSTNFWTKASDYLFDNALTSFREGIAALRTGIVEDREMYNYFSTLVFRMFSQPYTEVALNVFAEGFDLIASDPVFFKEAFEWNSKSLSKVEILLLFLCVHRNKITLAMDKRVELEKVAAAAAEIGRATRRDRV